MARWGPLEQQHLPGLKMQSTGAASGKLVLRSVLGSLVVGHGLQKLTGSFRGPSNRK